MVGINSINSNNMDNVYRLLREKTHYQTTNLNSNDQSSILKTTSFQAQEKQPNLAKGTERSGQDFPTPTGKIHFNYAGNPFNW